MGYYIDSTFIEDGERIDSADVKDPLDTLDEELYYTRNGSGAFGQMLFTQNTSPNTPTGTSAILHKGGDGLYYKLSGSTTKLVTILDLESPPTTIGLTTPAPGRFSSMLIGTTTPGNVLEVAGTGDTLARFTNSGTGEAKFIMNASAAKRATVGFQQNYVDKLEITLETTGGMYFYHTSSGRTFIELNSSGDLNLQPYSGPLKLGNSSGSGTLGFYGSTGITRKTYGAPTGTATRTSFATGSVTTAQLAEVVKALVDDFRSMGLFA